MFFSGCIIIGPDDYKLLKNLCDPDNPNEEDSTVCQNFCRDMGSHKDMVLPEKPDYTPPSDLQNIPPVIPTMGLQTQYDQDHEIADKSSMIDASCE